MLRFNSHSIYELGLRDDMRPFSLLWHIGEIRIYASRMADVDSLVNELGPLLAMTFPCVGR